MSSLGGHRGGTRCGAEFEAAVGIVTGAVGTLAESLRPLIDYGYLIYGLLLPTWFILTGWTLHTLGRHPDNRVPARHRRPYQRRPLPRRNEAGMNVSYRLPLAS